MMKAANTRPISPAFNFMLLLFYIADTDLQYTRILFPLASAYPSGSCTNYFENFIYIADTDLQYTRILFPLASVYPSGSCTNYLLEYYLGHTVPRGAFL